MLTGKALRPELTDDQAEQFRLSEVMRYTGDAGAETVDPWDPTKGSRIVNEADYVVGQGEKFLSVQAAIGQAIRDAARGLFQGRVYIEIRPGRYEGLIYFPKVVVDGKALKFTLFSRAEDAASTVLYANIDGEMPGAEFEQRFGKSAPKECEELFATICNSGKITTGNACVLRVASDDFEAFNFSVENTYLATRGGQSSDGQTTLAPQMHGQHQAVALMVDGADRVRFEGVALKSFQDTLYLKSPRPFSTARSYFRNCKIAGDVDFIFGQATAYFDACTLVSRGERGAMSWVTAPATNLNTRYGLVFNACNFEHDTSARALEGNFSLGRQWFEAVRATPYGQSPDPSYACRIANVSSFDAPDQALISRATLEAVGKCVILRSRIGAHINPAAPWEEWNGGKYDRFGQYIPGPWAPRYRPVQTSFQDFLRYLDPWLESQGIELQLAQGCDTFLAEYQNEMVLNA